MRHLLGLIYVGMTIVVMCGTPVSAQSGYDEFGSGRSSALGYASTALSTSAGVHANPAATAAHERRLVSVYVREGFGLASLRYGAGYATLPLNWGALSAAASTFGNDVYREIHYSAGYARSFQFGTSRSIHLGTLARYYHTHIEGYGSSGAIGLHFGLLYSLFPSLQIGAKATNVNAPTLGEEEVLPQTLSIGLRYRADSRLQLVADVFKDVRFPLSVRSGMEVRPIPMIALRAGVTTAPTRFTGGVGIRLGRIRTHLSAEQHPDLGWTPSASLEVRW